MATWKEENLLRQIREENNHSGTEELYAVIRFGGSVGEKITGNQAKTIIKYAVKVGCEHFAINTVYSICENEHWTLGEVDKCPQCQKPTVDHATRVVGFLTRTSDWNKKKKLYDFDKRTYGDLEGKPLK